MKIYIKHNVDEIENGDLIVLTNNRGVRMIVQSIEDGYYGALDLDTGKIYKKSSNIKAVVSRYEIGQIIKNKNLVLTSDITEDETENEREDECNE